MRAACREARHDDVATFTSWQLFIDNELQAGERSKKSAHPTGVALKVMYVTEPDDLDGHLWRECLSKGRRASVHGLGPLAQAGKIVVGGQNRLLLKFRLGASGG